MNRIMKNIMVLALPLVFSGISYSQTTVISAGIASQSDNSLLWKISGPGISKPSYLFGTMHLLCASDAILSDGLKSVLANCEEVYFEIDISDMNAMLNSLKFMRMNDNKRLSDLLDSTSYARVKTYFQEHASMLPFSMLERFKPLLISNLIEENEMSCKTTDGMEMVILKELGSQNKKVHGLETAEFQAGLFDSIPYEKQAENLVNSIDSSENYKKMTDILAEAYRQQNLQKINELTSQEDPGMQPYMDLLLYGRNRKWVKAMKDLLPEKSRLFAVGAGHLPGEQGLIELLRKSGYVVTPVKN